MGYPVTYKSKLNVGEYVPDDKVDSLIAKVTKKINEVYKNTGRAGQETVTPVRSEFLQPSLHLVTEIDVVLPADTTATEIAKINKALKDEIFAVQIAIPPDMAPSSLLLHADASPVVDSSTITTKSIANNGVTIDTANKVFGAGSLLITPGNYLQVANSNDFNIGWDDYTLDFRVKFNSFLQYNMFVDRMDDLRCFFTAYNNMLIVNGYEGTGWDWAPVTGVWYHVAVVRISGETIAYVNGQALGLGHQDPYPNLASTEVINIGTAWNQSQMLDANIDELRIVKGVGLWASNFTPPVAAYQY